VHEETLSVTAMHSWCCNNLVECTKFLQALLQIITIALIQKHSV